jgi:hypothetical protein
MKAVRRYTIATINIENANSVFDPGQKQLIAALIQRVLLIRSKR